MKKHKELFEAKNRSSEDKTNYIDYMDKLEGGAYYMIYTGEPFNSFTEIDEELRRYFRSELENVYIVSHYKDVKNDVHRVVFECMDEDDYSNQLSIELFIKYKDGKLTMAEK